MQAFVAKPSLAELKQLIGVLDGRAEKTRHSFRLFPQGLVAGTVCEIAGHGKTQFAVEFLKTYPDFQAAWVEPEISANPYAFWQQGVQLHSLSFIQTGDESIWALQQVLQSQVFNTVIVSGIELPEKDLRRFQLLVEKSESHLLLLKPELKPSWIPALQLKASRVCGQVEVEVMKRRGGL